MEKFKYLYWCNECDWEERMTEHKYDFCPKCGHINIGKTSNSKANIGTVVHVNGGKTSLTKAISELLKNKGLGH